MKHYSIKTFIGGIKKATLLIFLFFGKAYSQELNYVNGKIQYELIVEKAELSKEVIYKYSKRWTANSFKDSKYVLRNDDEKNGEIIGVGNTYFRGTPKKKFLWYPEISVEFNFMINIKEGKARLRFYDIKRLTRDSYSDDGYEREPLEEVDAKSMKGKGRSLDNWIWTVKIVNDGFKELLTSYKTAIVVDSSDDF